MWSKINGSNIFYAVCCCCCHHRCRRRRWFLCGHRHVYGSARLFASSIFVLSVCNSVWILRWIMIWKIRGRAKITSKKRAQRERERMRESGSAWSFWCSCVLICFFSLDVHCQIGLNEVVLSIRHSNLIIFDGHQCHKITVRSFLPASINSFWWRCKDKMLKIQPIPTVAGYRAL